MTSLIEGKVIGLCNRHVYDTVVAISVEFSQESSKSSSVVSSRDSSFFGLGGWSIFRALNILIVLATVPLGGLEPLVTMASLSDSLGSRLICLSIDE